MSSFVLGYRKLVVCLVAIVAIWVGSLARVIPGDTAAWAIVAVVSVAVTGYAGEYFFQRPGRDRKRTDSQGGKDAE